MVWNCQFWPHWFGYVRSVDLIETRRAVHMWQCLCPFTEYAWLRSSTVTLPRWIPSLLPKLLGALFDIFASMLISIKEMDFLRKTGKAEKPVLNEDGSRLGSKRHLLKDSGFFPNRLIDDFLFLNVLQLLLLPSIFFQWGAVIRKVAVLAPDESCRVSFWKKIMCKNQNKQLFIRHQYCHLVVKATNCEINTYM